MQTFRLIAKESKVVVFIHHQRPRDLTKMERTRVGSCVHSFPLSVPFGHPPLDWLPGPPFFFIPFGVLVLCTWFWHYKITTFTNVIPPGRPSLGTGYIGGGRVVLWPGWSCQQFPQTCVSRTPTWAASCQAYVVVFGKWRWMGRPFCLIGQLFGVRWPHDPCDVEASRAISSSWWGAHSSPPASVSPK